MLVTHPTSPIIRQQQVGRREADGSLSLVGLVEAHRSRIHKISDKRVYIPAKEPYMEGHNTWVANRPGSLLVIPTGDVAQHAIANLCFLFKTASASMMM
jgi:hypothetical protein